MLSKETQNKKPLRYFYELFSTIEDDEMDFYSFYKEEFDRAKGEVIDLYRENIKLKAELKAEMEKNKRTV